MRRPLFKILAAPLPVLGLVAAAACVLALGRARWGPAKWYPIACGAVGAVAVIQIVRMLEPSLTRRRPLVLEDPEFGRLVFEQQGTWASLREGARCPFMLVVDAPTSGPSDDQRHFLRRLLADFPRLEALGRAFVDTHRSGREPLRVYALGIPADEELSAGRFTIEYVDEAAEAVHRAEFAAYEPRHYGEDD